MMQKAINYYQLTNIQPVFKQWQSLGNTPSSFIYDHDIIWYLPLVSLHQLSQLCTLPASYLLPTYLLVGEEGKSLDTAYTLFSNN